MTEHADRRPHPTEETAMTAIATVLPQPRTVASPRTAVRRDAAAVHRVDGALPAPGLIGAQARRESARSLRSLAAVVSIACVEVEVGRRSLRDLSRWLDLPVYEKLARRIDLLERTGRLLPTQLPPQPVGVRVCQVSETVAEASATVRSGDRVRAIALRLERRLSRWRVTAVEIG